MCRGEERKCEGRAGVRVAMSSQWVGRAGWRERGSQVVEYIVIVHSRSDNTIPRQVVQ